MTATPPTIAHQTTPQTTSLLSYTSPATPLQTLEIWLPRPLSASSLETTVWIVYIHGGAWRDPELTSSQLEPTLRRLFPAFPSFEDAGSSRAVKHIAGFASLNYRLSPYKNHPTHPSDDRDESRNVTHPAHVGDIAKALEWLEREYNVTGNSGQTGGARGYEWVGVGHSCGATMLLQLVTSMGQANILSVCRPVALILLAGIYDLPVFLQNHSAPKVSTETQRVYTEIIEGAFGTDKRRWLSASPVAGDYSPETWSKGRMVVLAHSKEDELVEEEQVNRLVEVLERQGWGVGRQLLERELKGGHDFVWEDGEQVAALIEQVTLMLFE
ncbi:alpha/beta-hydrolase [Lepidopterella palustris CBS 459.81]|uniref:Kynurenine formamidase n=1 Tax=Lepidopterella palustris CBS 459.81 TaxID=1314670 RepID=A0A8E2JKM7_9PEZI|nr:alpha/beta-hydrolase [Lepidopterella palustris CBS 459.81]